MKKFLAMISMVAFSGLAIAQSATGEAASGGQAGGAGGRLTLRRLPAYFPC